MSWGVKYSWHPPFGAFTRKSDAQAEAKLVRDANRQAGLKGPVKVVKVVVRNPSKRKTLKRVGAALKKWVRGNPSQGLGLTAAQIRLRIKDAESSLPAKDRELRRVLTIYKRELRRLKANPSRVKGRKVKGGRAVTLKNMESVTITRKSNGVVSVRGVQLKGRKR